MLAKTSAGRLTEQIVFHGEGPETEKIHICSSSGAHFVLPEGPEGNGYSSLFAGLTFAGGQTAALAFEWGSTREPELWVVSLADGRRIFKTRLPSDRENFETLEVGRIVLQRDGSVAWAQLTSSGTCEVIEHTSHGTKVLDDTHTAEPESLKLSGDRLTWSEQGGAVRTATLR